MKNFDAYTVERNTIETLCKKYKLTKYTITSDNLVNVGGSVEIKNMNLYEIEIPFGTVNGDFDCSDNRLTTLANLPSLVMGTLNIKNNGLKSLDGCTDRVNMNFICSGNDFTNLLGGPSSVRGSYNLSSNPRLKSLDGIAPNAKSYNISDNASLPHEIQNHQRHINHIINGQYRFSIWDDNGKLNLTKFQDLLNSFM